MEELSVESSSGPGRIIGFWLSLLDRLNAYSFQRTRTIILRCDLPGPKIRPLPYLMNGRSMHLAFLSFKRAIWPAGRLMLQIYDTLSRTLMTIE